MVIYLLGYFEILINVSTMSEKKGFRVEGFYNDLSSRTQAMLYCPSLYNSMKCVSPETR